MSTIELPATQYLNRSGGRVAFDDTGGGGPLIIAAPGMGDTRGSYRHVRHALHASGTRFVTMDLRGQGDSDATFADYTDGAVAGDYLALVEDRQAGPALLVGNSLSCAAAVIAAAERPDLVSGIVLLAPFVRPADIPQWQQRLFAAGLAGPWGRAAWVGYYRTVLYPGAKPPDHDRHVAAVKSMLAGSGRMHAFRRLAANDHATSAERLAAVTVPAVVVMGTADPDYPDATAEARAVAQILGAELVLAEGSGHYPQADQPAAVVPAILGALASGTAS